MHNDHCLVIEVYDVKCPKLHWDKTSRDRGLCFLCLFRATQFFPLQAANSDIGWTLGYMLNLTNMIPSEGPRPLRGHEEGVWAAGIFFIVATLALCLVLLLVHCLR